MEKTYDKAKIEYGKWLNTLDESKLNPYEITVINIITKYFDEFKENVVANKAEFRKIERNNDAKIAKIFGAYANKDCDTKLVKLDDKLQLDEKDEIKRLLSIEIESFRGFMKKTLPINLDKEFTLIWGANGTGKTSFCEALEYALTRNVNDARQKRINLQEYIKNRYTDQGKIPYIRARYEGNIEKDFEYPYYKYEYAFLERNRIDDFSRSLGHNDLTEQLGDLFGLTDFFAFVSWINHGHNSLNCDDFILYIDDDLRKNYDAYVYECDFKTKRLAELESDEEKIEKELQCIENSNGENKIQELRAKKQYILEKIDIINKEIINYRKDYKELVDEYNKRKNIIEKNKKIMAAYENVGDMLDLYKDKVTKDIAHNIGALTKDFYNAMNEDDAEYELIDDIKIPTSNTFKLKIFFKKSPDHYSNNNQKILIRFKGAAEDEYVDAMRVLSEGHVKILGLSMLLAKACNDKMPFLVFDDIVNAIDDDHRVGVAKLLAGTSIDSPLKNMQKIVTCHGRQFISLLAGEIHSSARYNEYVLLPADVRGTRDIEIKLKENDSTKVIKRAIGAYKEDERKIALLYCRQAAESITENLWRTLEKLKIEVIVEKRSFSRDPDLNARVRGLISSLEKEIKNKTEGLQDIVNILKELVSKPRLWRLMNEGAHYNNDQAEFDRSEISKVIGLLEQLDEIVHSMSIEKRVSCNIIEPTKLD